MLGFHPGDPGSNPGGSINIKIYNFLLILIIFFFLKILLYKKNNLKKITKIYSLNRILVKSFNSEIAKMWLFFNVSMSRL